MTIDALEDLSATRGGPPSDVAAERSVLGAVLQSPRVRVEVINSGLTPDDFYLDSHSTIYAAITRMDAAGKPVDGVTVRHELALAGDLARVGDAPYLHTLIASTPVVANGAYYATIVRDRARLRRLVQAGTRIVQLGYAGDGPDADAIAAAAEHELRVAIEAGAPTASGTDFAERFDPLLEEVHTPLPDRTAGIRSGFTDLDRALDPMLPGQLIVVGARPTVGKSTFVRDVARHAAFRQRRRVLLHTLEMSTPEVERAILSAEAGVLLTALKRHELTTRDSLALERVRDRIADAALIIDDHKPLTLAGLRASIRRHRPDLVIVDQLQHVEPAATKRSNGDSRQREVGEISRGLKLLAGIENVPIMVCSKVNRESEKSPSKVPTMAMLRDSGEIESDADTVLMIHREDMHEKETPRAGEVDIIIEKQRSGERGVTVTLVAQLHFARFAGFSEPAWSPSSSLREASR